MGKTSVKDLYWLAGLLEGEGCFSDGRIRGKVCPKITLNMTDEDVVRKAAAMLEPPSVRTVQSKRPNEKLQWVIALSGVRAAGWMMTLHTLLGNRRRAKIQKVLLEWYAQGVRNKYRMECVRGHPYTDQPTGGRRCEICYTATKQRGIARRQARYWADPEYRATVLGWQAAFYRRKQARIRAYG